MLWGICQQGANQCPEVPYYSNPLEFRQLRFSSKKQQPVRVFGIDTLAPERCARQHAQLEYLDGFDACT